MTFDSNFFIIIFILISVLLYFNLSSEKFENEIKCSDLPKGPCSSALCVLKDKSCKASLSDDGENCYCVDSK
jgi:hypothetical protein